MAIDKSKYSEEISSDFIKFGTEAESKVWHEQNEGQSATFVTEIAGMLEGIETNERDGRSVGKYKLELEDGRIVTFQGTAILDDKLSMCEIGDDILIEYVGSEKAKQSGHSPMKQFKVSKAP